VERRAVVYQFQPRDIERICKALSCSRAQLAARLGVSRACVSRWEKGFRAPQRADAARLRSVLGESLAPSVDVFDLRTRLRMPQPYTMFNRSGHIPVAGVMTRPDGMNAPSFWAMYVGVPTREDAVTHIKRLGGGELSQVIEVPTVGRMQMMKDPQGAAFALRARKAQ
jgi:predicted enzyme related to lactoylglutathione lyase